MMMLTVASVVPGSAAQRLVDAWGPLLDLDAYLQPTP